ncbi:MAG: hypothetical protein PWR03_1171 [Tenuifilum sp.]|jgi:hypothetical protein|uniref:hypothetical protein n=1 Tax=Tenuifilum sp. TaxID=2760880 RepID=UPI0024AAA7F8|nr:hypothetical protein [Tenuifilum sp.]MDI3526988.1 hypothetical protein [Tenuifilum sp.]
MVFSRFRKSIRQKQLGLYSGQLGVYRRYLREKEGWDRHLNNTKEFILQKVRSLSPKSICVLGSGYLLDFPTEKVLDLGIKLTLVDIAHPAEVVKKYASNNQVEFVTKDLTGGLVSKLTDSKLKDVSFFTLINIVEKCKPAVFNADMVISLNLLSQLSDIPIEFLRNKKLITDWQSIEIANSIQNKHIESLPHGKSLLISDIMEEYFDSDGKLAFSRPVVYVDLSGLSEVQEWVWDFDSSFTYNEDYITKMQVVAGRV